MAINRKASSEVEDDKGGERKFKDCHETRKSLTKIFREDILSGGFPAESEKHNGLHSRLKAGQQWHALMCWAPLTVKGMQG